MVKGWRVGRRETFFEKAHGVLYSGRKHKSTQAGFIGACVLSVAFGLGATLSGIDLAVDTPMSPGMFPEANTGKVATFVAMGGLAVIAYSNAANTADSWWIDETGRPERRANHERTTTTCRRHTAKPIRNFIDGLEKRARLQKGCHQDAGGEVAAVELGLPSPRGGGISLDPRVTCSNICEYLPETWTPSPQNRCSRVAKLVGFVAVG